MPAIDPRTAALAACLALALPGAGADKNGVGPNAISLPAGPGSIEGLGASFEPTLNTGTARHAIPLRLPPGPGGSGPELRLDHEGGLGNGPLGFGWTLTLPHVQRRADRGIPRYVDGPNGIDDDHDGGIDEPDEPDAFVDESGEQLVPLADGTRFRENEGGFIRYRPRDGGWEATLPEGVRLEFGLTPEGRVAEPESGRVFRWLLERRIDPHGNVQTWHWAGHPGEANRHQRYLAGMAWGPGAPPWDHFHFVRFEYEDRPDPFEDGRAGFLVRTGRRLRSVWVGTQGAGSPPRPGQLEGDFNGDGIQDRLVRRYDLGYRPVRPDRFPGSLLASVRMVGADGISALPPATFEYTACELPDTVSAEGHWIGGMGEPPRGVDDPSVEFIDLNGDGLPDILRTVPGGGAHRVHLNAGPAGSEAGTVIRWHPPVEVAAADGRAWNLDLGSFGEPVHLADMNGDGLADLVHRTAGGEVWYYANDGRAGWGPRQAMSLTDAPPPAPFDTPGVRTADLDFDRRMDIVQSLPHAGGADYRIWFNLGGGRYSRPVTVAQEHGFDFEASGVHLADLNGDGVMDVARVRPASVLVTAGLGHGRFAPPVVMTIPDGPLDEVQVGRARLEDVTGDGLADLVLERAAPGQLWFWLNHGNGTFGPLRVVTGMPVGEGLAPTVRWADLNGNGTADLVYADSESEPRLLAVDLGERLGCVPAANLLTRIEYRTSTRYAVEDAGAGRPWNDPLPFPMNLVARVVTGDSLGDAYVTEYRYGDGYYDAAEREFRGFARVEERRMGDAESPTLVVRSEFDTGRGFAGRKGRLLRESHETADGGVFWEEATLWTDPPRLLHLGTNGVAVTHVAPVERTRIVRELGSGPPRTIRTRFEFDAYGNATLEAQFGVVEGDDPSALGDERIVKASYAINPLDWLVRFPHRSETTDLAGNVLSRAESFYDDPTFSGSNPGSVTAGLLTLRREWVDPERPEAFVEAARYRYDAYGNRVWSLDPLAVVHGGMIDRSAGHGREVTFDPRFQSYPVRETLHLGGGSEPLTFEAEHDEGFGVVTGSTDFNGHRTRYEHDALARLVRIFKPGDTDDRPTSVFRYGVAVPVTLAGTGEAGGPGATGRVNFVETRRLNVAPDAPSALDDEAAYHVARQYFDGLGRPRQTRLEAEPATPGGPARMVVRDAVRFNARQAIAVRLNPFFSQVDGADLEARLAWESLDAPGWTGRFEEDGVERILGLAEAPRTTHARDATLREISVTHPDGARRRQSFSPLATRFTDENASVPTSPHRDTAVVHHTDGLGRLVRVEEITRLNDDGTSAAPVDPEGAGSDPALRTWTTRHTYDANDQLVRIEDALGNVKRYAHDGLRRLVLLDDPDRGRTEFEYDAASNRIRTRDALGRETRHTYDGANRMRTEDYLDDHLPSPAGFRYDPARPITAENRPDVVYFHDVPASFPEAEAGGGPATNTRGKLAGVWDLSGEEHRSYDDRGRTTWLLKRVRDPIHGELVPFLTRFEHDALDRLTRLVYPDNDAVEYRYNGRRLLDAIRGEAAGVAYRVEAYTAADLPARLVFGNGVTTTHTYDTRLRLQSSRTVPDDPAAVPFYDLAFRLDGTGNVVGIDDRRWAPGGDGSGSPTRTREFTYDDRHRLTEVAYRGGPDGRSPDGAMRFRYDRIGNLVARSATPPSTPGMETGFSPGTLHHGGTRGSSGRVGADPAHPGPHALTGIHPDAGPAQTLEYDPNGNLIRRGDTVYRWDFRNRLVGLETPRERFLYAYDHADRRVSRRREPRTPNGTGAGEAPSVVLEVNRHFEVRENEAPTKYVHDGDSRLLQTTGAFTDRPRRQFLRLAKGWNLVALAVDLSPDDPAWQAGMASGIGAMAVWEAGAGRFGALEPGLTLPAGTILWVRADRAFTWILRGRIGAPGEPGRITAEGFAGAAALAPIDLEAPEWSGASVWRFEASGQRWVARWNDEGTPPADGPFPRFLPQGAAAFVRGTPMAPPAQDPARWRYFHADPLGSVIGVTDALGRLVEEIDYHPFGEVRRVRRDLPVATPFGFNGKEAEADLHAFEARQVAVEVGRFVSPDPLYAEPSALDPARRAEFLGNPQSLNAYAFVLNNPLTYRDPTGLEPERVMVAHKGVKGFLRNAQRREAENAGQAQTVLSGHGEFPYNRTERDPALRQEIQNRPRFIEVPEGTRVTFYARHGQVITDSLGQAIEKNQVPVNQHTETFGPGQLVPNYLLHPPTGLVISFRIGDAAPVTVDQPVFLQDLLKPGMGEVHWAACLEDRGGASVIKQRSVDVAKPPEP